MTFVFDLDDTICDTDSYSEKYIAEFLGKNKWPYKQIAKEVRFAESKFDWNRDTALAWYKEFGDQMMLEFPCKKGVVEVLNRLHDAGHKIVIATARANDWHTKPNEITTQWLANNNIPYDKIYIGRIDKEKICEEENADVFVDDDIKITSRVAEYFKTQGGNKFALLATTEYNKNLDAPDGVERISNFEEIMMKLKAENVFYHGEQE